MSVSAETRLAVALRGCTTLVVEMSRRRMRTVQDLGQLTLAEWWRLSGREFPYVANAAIQARVCPNDLPDLEVLRQVMKPTLYDGLRAANLNSLAATMLRAGIGSHLLVSRLTRADILAVRYMDRDRLGLLVHYLTGQGIRLATR